MILKLYMLNDVRELESVSPTVTFCRLNLVKLVLLPLCNISVGNKPLLLFFFFYNINEHDYNRSCLKILEFVAVGLQ